MELSILGLRVLLSFLNSENNKRTVTDIARSLGEEKYTISRIIHSLEEKGLIAREGSKPYLTELGKEKANYYHQRLSIILNALIYKGVDINIAMQDSLNAALLISEQSMELLSASHGIYKLKQALKNKKNFTAGDVTGNLPDGVYKLPFVIYKMKMNNYNNISMANDGFHNPCLLIVKNNVGIVQVHALSAKHKSALSGRFLQGKIQSLQYYSNGMYVLAEQTSDIVSIPLEAFRFRGFGNNENMLIHGSIVLKILVSVGITNMPESEAMFTLLI